MFKEYCTAKNVTFFILVLVILLIIPKITGILLLFFASFVLASAMNPFVEKLAKRMKRSLASSLAIIIAGLVVLAAFVPILLITYREINAFYHYLPTQFDRISNFFSIAKIHGENITDLIDFSGIIGPTSELAHNLFNQSVNFTVGIVQLCVFGVAVTMILYYLLNDKAYLKEKFVEFFPNDLKEKASYILSSISVKVGSYVRAQILSMVAVGIMTTIALAILNIDYAVMLGIVTGVLDIIPLLGPALSLVVILLVAYPVSIIKFILIIALFLLIQQLSNYVVRPVLFGKFMKLHPLMVFFALFIAQQFLGIWGVILSPAIAATVCVLIDELYLMPINNNKELAQPDYE